MTPAVSSNMYIHHDYMETVLVYDILFDQDGDATLFAGLFREHTVAAARRLPSRGPRIDAEWKLHHRVWDLRNNHERERRKLGEIMEDDEHIEALAWAPISPSVPERKAKSKGHNRRHRPPALVRLQTES